LGSRAPNSLLPREDRRSEQRGQMEKKPLVILQTDLCSVTQLRGRDRRKPIALAHRTPSSARIVGRLKARPEKTLIQDVA